MNQSGSVILTKDEQQLSLEDRREARKEHALRFLASPDEKKAQQVYKGAVAQWGEEMGTRVMPWHQSVEKPGTAGLNGFRTFQVEVPEGTFNLDPVRKRTPQERLESMTKRLLESMRAGGMNSVIVQAELANIAGEYWKLGTPVTVDALKVVAAHYLHQGEKSR